MPVDPTQRQAFIDWVQGEKRLGDEDLHRQH